MCCWFVGECLAVIVRGIECRLGSTLERIVTMSLVTFREIDDALGIYFASTERRLRKLRLCVAIFPFVCLLLFFFNKKTEHSLISTGTVRYRVLRESDRLAKEQCVSREYI